MSVQHAYNSWAAQYDTNENKTRDLEAIALRSLLENLSFSNCLEIGCGTGKNSGWLITRTQKLTAVDFSVEMLEKAKSKFAHGSIEFIQTDINEDWQLPHQDYDLVTFSLVLEHISNLHPVFSKAVNHLVPGGHIYVGELHPFKQYSGSKARFETEEGLNIVECYNHHLSDFLDAADAAGLQLVVLKEFFDDDDRSQLPRILNLLFKKPT